MKYTMVSAAVLATAILAFNPASAHMMSCSGADMSKMSAMIGGMPGDEQAFGGDQRRNGQRRPARMQYDDEENDDGLKNVDDEVRNVIGQVRRRPAGSIRGTS
jgi:hypothetical protein